MVVGIALAMAFVCSHCQKTFLRKYNKDRHEEQIHGLETQVLDCYFCSEEFSDFALLRQHAHTHEPDTRFTLMEDYFDRVLCTYVHTPAKVYDSVEELVHNLRRDLNSLLRFELLRNTSMKAVLIFHLGFVKDVANGEGEFERLEHCVRMPYSNINHVSEIQTLIRSSVRSCEKRIYDYTHHGSGWILEEIQRLDLRTIRAPPLRGSCNLLSVSKLQDVKKLRPAEGANYQDCFQRCVALSFVGEDEGERLRQFVKTYFDYGQKGAISVAQIKTFERRNPRLDVRVNVMYLDGNNVYPIYRSSAEGKNTVNLLLFRSRVQGEVVGHYLLVQDVNQFLRKSYKRSTGKSYQRGFRCENCLSFFYSAKTLKTHVRLCKNFQPQLVRVPMEGEFLEFKREGKCIKLPLLVFFDFEAVNHALDQCRLCEVGRCTHKKTLSLTQQVPICYSAIAVNRTGKVIWQVTHSGYDSAQHFVTTLLNMEPKFIEYIGQNVEMIWTEKDATRYREQEKCHICREELGTDRVRDHDHLTGRFIGGAHNICNLTRREQCKIPVLCHNFVGYDGQFILRCLPTSKENIWTLKGLPTNGEKLKTLQLNNFHFVDTLDFLQGSLADLVRSLNESHTFSLLDQSMLYKSCERELKDLLLEKGVYCYEWATSLTKLEKTKKLPPQREFFSHLSNNEVTDDDYKRAQKVFKLMKCENMLDYTLNYCLLDVHLLAEVFCKFREEIFTETELDCW